MTLRMAPGDGIAVRPVIDVVTMGLSDPAVGGVSLPLPYVSQRPYTNLCWAACVEMVFRLNAVNSVPMCQMCSQALGTHDCCGEWDDSICDYGHWPQDIYNWGQFNCLSMNAPADPDSVRRELDARRPVEVFYQWKSGGGYHTALIYGYNADGTFLVADPWFGQLAPLPYDSIVNAYGRGGWMVTYHHLARMNA